MEYHVYRQGLEQPSCSNSRCSHQCADTYDKITGKVVDASGVFFTSDVCMFILLQNTMCAGKALNNNRTAIRDALIKVFVESALSTPPNNVENKVIASVFGESSMQAVISVQSCKGMHLGDDGAYSIREAAPSAHEDASAVAAAAAGAFAPAAAAAPTTAVALSLLPASGPSHFRCSCCCCAPRVGGGTG